ncbi:YfjI family protein [Malikia sp.]|uniref:YfjI family protein n=1 Tax=Malikia sp. TaxID=2070706 RepID=UPI002617D419|nr:YfjI family protein [Malikia sp.]MDD2728681.1 YfjI family protein [Malikia sp.]
MTSTDWNQYETMAAQLDAEVFPALPDAPEGLESALPGMSGTWPEPVPLPDGLPPVAPFDAELLPEALRGWVADIAHRMQCPPDFTAVGVLVAISSLIGARAVVKPKERDDWTVTPNLWGLVVGRPGVMKSPALSQTMAPLDRLEATEREVWKMAHEAWELDCKVAELAAKANEKTAARVAAKDPAQARALLQPADAPTEPKARRYVVNDATVEKLADMLTVNPWGLLVYRDELHGLLCSMDKQGQEGARGFYLTGYDGNQGYAVDRIGRGESYVSRVCLAMLGGIQPGKVQSYVREAVAGGASDDGLLQRFGLAVWPDIAREFHKVDQWPDTQAKQAAWAVFERLKQLQPASDTQPQAWRFTPEAQALYWEWAEPFETEIRGDELHPALVSHLSKYRKLVPALALVFALVDTPDSDGVIHDAELLRALAWADYLRTHAERLYSAAVIPETAGAQALLTKIKAGKLTDSDGVLLDGFTPRQVAVKHWAGLGAVEPVRKAADLLADYGWLEREAMPSSATGGRPSERYLIHPQLLKRGQ